MGKIVKKKLVKINRNKGINFVVIYNVFKRGKVWAFDAICCRSPLENQMPVLFALKIARGISVILKTKILISHYCLHKFDTLDHHAINPLLWNVVKWSDTL